MTIALAVLAPLIIGFADHLGVGLARSGRPIAVVLWIYLSSVPFTIASAVLVGGTPGLADMALGALAGMFAATALMALYNGYAGSGVGVVAPVAAVTGAVVPIAAATIISGVPSSVVQGGLLVGLAAVWFIGFDRSGAALDGAALRYGTMAGVLFGGMSVTLGLTEVGSGIYPIIATRAVSVPVIYGVLRTRGVSPRRDESWGGRLVVIGVAAALGPAAFTLAAQQNLAVAGLFMQMAYGFTVFFQVLFAGERATKAQTIGFALAILSLTMISLG